MNEINRLLKELMLSEVIPAVERYNSSVPSPRLWINDSESLNMLSGAMSSCGVTYLSAAVWRFSDHMQHRSMPERARAITGALGVSKDMFWCLVLAYAMYDGLRDYRTYHSGHLPDNDAAYLYAILTADDLAAEVKKDF